MTFIDTHAHLDLPEFNADRHETIQRAFHEGIKQVITVGIGLKECTEALRIAGAYAGIYAALGVHPHNARGLDRAALDFLEQHARQASVVALGEMGLDFYRNRAPKQDQLRCFRAQLDLAQHLDLPVIIHNRDAHNDTLCVLREAKAWKTGGVIHCFSGDSRMAHSCIDMGFYISIPGTVTFKNAHSLREVVRSVPLEHLLIETDAPFLAPVPFRGKRNEPAHVKLVAQEIARLKDMPLEHVAAVTGANARRLFSLPG